MYELNTLFRNLVTVSRLSRVPSIKEMARDAQIEGDRQAVPYLVWRGIPRARGAGERRARARRTDGHVCARILLGPSRAIPCSPIMRSSTATGRVGDVEVKTRLAVALNRYLAPIRERLAINEARPGLVETILGDGTQRMRAIAAETMP